MKSLVVITLSLSALFGAEEMPRLMDDVKPIDMITIDQAHGAISPDIMFEEGFFMEGYNGLLLIGRGASRVEGDKGYDFQTGPNCGYKLALNGTIICIVAHPDGTGNVRSSVKTNVHVTHDEEWIIANNKHLVFYVGDNLDFFNGIKKSLLGLK